MKNILFIVPTLSTGGAERVVSEIASSLYERNYKVSILNYYHSDNAYKLADNLTVFYLVDGNLKDYKKVNFFAKRRILLKILKQLNPDVIIPFLDHVCIQLFFYTFFTKYCSRLIFTERNNNKFLSKSKLLIKRFCQIFVKKTIVQNKGQKDILPNIISRKAIIIPNPISSRYLNYKKNYKARPTKIVSIGRLCKQKNYELAIKAFYLLQQKYNYLSYHIFGIGDEKEKLKNLTIELGIEKKVVFEGFTNDIDKIYKDSDIYLMTSRFEGMPNALAESMAVGIPVVSTNCEFGPSDLIENDGMGILLKDFEVNTLYERLCDLIENYELYIRNAIKTKKYISFKYCNEAIIQKWIDTFEKN